MISPHLLQVKVSHSYYKDYHPSTAEAVAEMVFNKRAPILILESTRGKGKPTKWCHMILADGPGLSEKAKKSELIIIWWSEMGPDTDRVLQAVDWEKHAKDFQY